jgi:hypothetical protein
VSGLKTADQLSAKVIERLALAPDEKLYFVYDGTVFGSASEGLAVTDRRLASLHGDEVTSIPYADLAALRIEPDPTDDTGHVHHFAASEASFGRIIERVMHLGPENLRVFVATLEKHVAPGLMSIERSSYIVAARKVRCGHCGGESFRSRKLILDNRGLALFQLDFLAAGATALECIDCGHLEIFTRAPTRPDHSSRNR